MQIVSSGSARECINAVYTWLKLQQLSFCLFYVLFFLFPKNERLWNFMQIVSYGFAQKMLMSKQHKAALAGWFGV